MGGTFDPVLIHIIGEAGARLLLKQLPQIVGVKVQFLAERLQRKLLFVGVLYKIQCSHHMRAIVSFSRMICIKCLMDHSFHQPLQPAEGMDSG
ncbi:hypothetical protein D3C74_402260 [compost metagenome]